MGKVRPRGREGLGGISGEGSSQPSLPLLFFFFFSVLGFELRA
jgi:hypothetical protein